MADSVTTTSSAATEQPRTPDGRYAADHRVTWLRGKTMDEVAALSDQMYAELVKRQPAAPAAAPAPATNGTAGLPTDDLWLTNPTAAGQMLLAHARQNEFAPAFANMAQQLGATAREVVKRDYADDFRKWGPEIDLYINQMDPQYRTIDNITKVVGVVRGNHIDEIAAERAQAKLNEMLNAGTVIRSGGAPNGTATAMPGAAVDFTKAELPAEYARTLSRYGVTSEKLDEFLLKTEVQSLGISLPEARERWLKRARAGDIITEASSGRVA